MNKLTDETMFRALVEKDASYEGIFFAGIKTTGIFCRPSCRARKPKRKNVEFFRTAKEAMQHGYRPCKVCHPLEFKGDTPGWLKPLLDEVELREEMKINDEELRAMEIDPVRVRRWFKKNHNMTFQTYLRLLRLGNAFGQIKNGEKVIESAFASGYESLSGFTESFKKEFGKSPKNVKHKNLIKVTRILTPLGPMLAGAIDDAICLLEFIDRRMLETQLARLKKYFKAIIVPGSSPLFGPLEKQLNEYFNGQRKDFNIPITFPGTEFQQSVWKVLQTIPYGQTRSYKEQAELIRRPEAVRAVARSNGDNRIAIIIPCHRVIGSNGTLTGYGGGLWRKEYLLELERKHS